MSKKLFYYGSTSSFSNPLSTEFDGINEYSDYGTASGLVGASEFSISMLIKLLSYPSYDARYWGDTGGYFYLYCTAAGTGQLRFAGGGTASNIETLSLNAWTHLVLTKKTGSVSKLYKNAVAGAAVGNTVNIPNLTNNFRMGGFGIAGLQINMRVNLWEVWNKELTGAEVTELYNGGAVINPALHSAAANLTHSYRSGNGDTYPTITDHTGVKNGTMTNMEAGDFVTDAP